MWLHEKLSFEQKTQVLALKERENGDSPKQPRSLVDYKFYCINGEPQFLYVSKGLENHSTARISFFAPFEKLPMKPERFDEMVEICRVLAKDIPFYGLIYYEINGFVYFSELLFSL